MGLGWLTCAGQDGAGWEGARFCPSLRSAYVHNFAILSHLQAILEEEELKDSVILVYANKQARSLCRSSAAWD